jgi:hypothetical protein
MKLKRGTSPDFLHLPNISIVRKVAGHAQVFVLQTARYERIQRNHTRHNYFLFLSCAYIYSVLALRLFHISCMMYLLLAQ